MTPLARLVRKRRRALGLSTAELGRLVLRTHWSVEKVEAGATMPTLEHALRWARALRVHPSTLLKAAERSVRVR